MKRYLVLCIFLFLSPAVMQGVFAQNRAPSCWLNRQDNYVGDIIINMLQVTAPSPTYTYYCALQWNAGAEGGGYCGIQEHPDGRNFIYSIWDPINSDEAITAAYTGEGTETENFGGEGTGLKSWNFVLGWETGRWYSFVSRAWGHDTHTMFGFWVYDHGDSVWHHLVTMDFPVAGVRFNSSTGSFIEDWYGNGWEMREAHYKEAWKRRTSDGTFIPVTRAYFRRVSPDDGAANYLDNYDGGVAGDHFFMKSGGTVLPATNTSGTWLTLGTPYSYPAYATGRLTALTSHSAGDTLYLSWETDSTATPPFAWHLEIYDNESLSGTPLLKQSDTCPHAREATVALSSLPANAEYFFSFSVTDLFDRLSNTYTDTLVYGQPASARNTTLDDMQVSPNPVTSQVNIRFSRMVGHAMISLTGTDGRILDMREYRAVSSAILPAPPVRGICYLTVTTPEERRTVALFIR